MTRFLTQSGVIIVMGGIQIKWAIGYWLLAIKPKAKSQQPMAALLKTQAPDNQ